MNMRICITNWIKIVRISAIVLLILIVIFSLVVFTGGMYVPLPLPNQLKEKAMAKNPTELLEELTDSGQYKIIRISEENLSFFRRIVNENYDLLIIIAIDDRQTMQEKSNKFSYYFNFIARPLTYEKGTPKYNFVYRLNIVCNNVEYYCLLETKSLDYQPSCDELMLILDGSDV